MRTVIPAMRLRSHLVILALAAGLPLLIFGIAIVRQKAHDERAVLENGMRDTVRALSLAVDGEIKASRAILETLAASALLDTGDLKAFHGLCVRAIEGRANEYVILFDASGQQVVNSSQPFGAPLPNPLRGAQPIGTDPRYPGLPVGGAAVVRKALETGQPLVSDLFVSLVTGGPRISVDVPVIRAGAVRHVLELSFDTEVFNRLLRRHDLPASSVASILDGNGLTIARSLDAARQLGRPRAPELAAHFGLSEGASRHGRTIEGRPVYHTFTRSSATGWITSLTVSEEVLTRPVRRSGTLLLGGVLTAALFALALAVVLGRRIATPISALAAAAPSLARGEDLALDPSAVREVRDLHQALVTASASVQEIAAERHGRKAAEVAERRASLLARATTALATSLEYERTLDAVADIIVPEVADGCAIDVADEQAIRRVVIRHHDPAREAVLVELSRRQPVDELAARAIQTQRSRLVAVVDDPFLRDIARDAEHLTLLKAAGIHSMLVAPIVVGDRAIGAVTLLSSDAGRRCDTASLALAEEMALRIGYAIDNARLYRAADAASRSKEEFLATLSHELRTPLNAVYGWARMLRDGRLSGDAATRGLDAIIRNAGAQVQLIDDVLDVSRVIAGKMRLDVQPVALEAVIEASLDAVRPAATAKDIRLESVLDSGAAPMMGDPTRLQQVVWNLLMNAVKFTPRGGRVQVHLLRINSHVEILVSDTGQGIAPEILPFIFERFRQGDSSSTRAHTGLGLGLALVRHLVDLHGGTVVARSAGEGKGATFIVKLPLSIAQIPAPLEPRVHPTAALPPVPGNTMRLDGVKVLVVDDDRDALDLAAAILGTAGASVRTCGSARSALDTLSGWRPDVLVSDIEMPEEDGYSLIRKVRALEADCGGKTPAIALTAYGRLQDRVLSLSAGYSMHVPKPVDPGELTTIVASLAGRALDPIAWRDRS